MSSTLRKSGFTLIELLVVISIIVIATAVLFVGGGGGGAGVKLSSAQRIVSSIAQGVRGQAILKNAPTRLIIYSEANTSGDPEKWLRFFGIVYWGEDANGQEGWLAATQGTYLPEGIYLNTDLSDNSGWTAPTMTLDYPRLNAGVNTDRANGGGSETYYYYEFNSNGTMASGFDNNWLVLQAGELKPDSSGTLTVNFENPEFEALKSALIFRRVGTTTLVKDPSEIN